MLKINLTQLLSQAASIRSRATLSPPTAHSGKHAAQNILTQHCSKNPDMAIGQILPKINPDTAQLSWPCPKEILTQLWRLAELGNCGVRIYFIFRQEPDALVSDATGS